MVHWRKKVQKKELIRKKIGRWLARGKKIKVTKTRKGSLGKPRKVEQIFSQYHTDESKQYIVEYPNGKKYFLRVPYKQRESKVLETFFLRSVLNVLHPQNSIKQVSIDVFDVGGKPQVGTLSEPLEGMSKDYYQFFHDYYGEAHGRSDRDPSRIRFFQKINTYPHVAFVNAVAKPLSGDIFWATGLALDTQGPVNVGNFQGHPIFFEAFRVRRTHKHYSTYRMLREAFRRRGITRNDLEHYWRNMPLDYRQKLLRIFDKIMK